MSATKQDVYVANEAEKISTLLGSLAKAARSAQSNKSAFKGAYYETSFPNKCSDLAYKIEQIKEQWDRSLGVWKNQVAHPLAKLN